MSAHPTLAAAKADLVGKLGNAAGLPVSQLRDLGVRRIYDHEPATRTAGLSITVSTGPTSPDFWSFFVRVHTGLQGDTKKAQDDLDAVMPVVDQVVGSGYGPSAWTGVEIGLDGQLIVTATYECGREDY